jgi:hypothetical protein
MGYCVRQLRTTTGSNQWFAKPAFTALEDTQCIHCCDFGAYLWSRGYRICLPNKLGPKSLSCKLFTSREGQTQNLLVGAPLKKVGAEAGEDHSLPQRAISRACRIMA